MKFFGWIVAVLLLFASCGGKHTGREAAATDYATVSDGSVPSAPDTTALPPVEQPEEDDGVFDDFVFNFASDTALQRRRIKFPLPVHEAGKTTRVQAADWKHDSLFAQQSCYTLLFDNEKEMDLEGDAALTSVQVEWIYPAARTVKKYSFEREKEVWMLQDIHIRQMEQGDGEDFADFYARFVTDSLYQCRHIRQPLRYVTIDPDDEFAILETTLDLNQWYAFSPLLPAERLSNICYGQKNEDRSRTKILKVNGIGNGFSNIFYFRKRAGEWELYKYEDTGI